MAVAGSLTYDTKIDKNGFEKGLNSLTNSVKTGGTKIKNIVSALGITQLIGKAISTINNSIDGAVSRIDTLNNFPKVMSNLGIEAKESTEAINALSDGLQGIPTTLDDAALAVQRFTSKNGNVNKSVNLFLAVNNALLAGGAGAEIQSSAMEQLSQAYAKGKPDMMEWRSIQTAMPAQLKQVSKAMLGNKDDLDKYLKKANEFAKANPLSSNAKELIEQLEEVKSGSGDMTTALGTALRTGIISMDDFMNTIVKLNKEGTGEFLSFEEQAKNSTGGIQTSITNAKTAITRGVANIVKTFDEVLKSNSLGGISTIISKIGSTAEKVLKKVASLIPQLVSRIKEVYNWTNKNKELIKNVIIIVASLTAGYIAYRKALITIQAIKIAKDILGTVSAFLNLIPAIKSAKDAMLLLNMAFNANPVGLVVAGVLALITALVLFANKQTESEKASKKFAEEMEKSKKAYEEYNQSVDKATEADLAQINSISMLKDELKTLVDENGNVKKGYESRVDFILKQLNEALGIECKRTGDVIQGYRELQGEIDKLVEKKKAEIILEGKKQKWEKANEEEIQATKDLTEAYKNLEIPIREAKNRIEDYYNAKEKLYGKRQGEELTENEHDAFWNYTKKEIKALEEKTKAYEDAESRVKQCTENKKDYEKNYALFVEEKYNEIGNTIENTTSSWSDTSLNTIKDTIKQERDNLEIYKKLYEETGNTIYIQQQKQAQLNLENLANELVARTKTLGELGEEEKQAWKMLGENSYENYSIAISQMGPDMQQKIQEATGIIAAGTPEMQAKAEELGRKTVEAFDKSADAKQKGLSMITSYLQGVSNEDKRELLRQAGIENVDEVLEQLDRGDLSEENGKNILQGLWNGLKNGTWQGKILGVASGLAQSVNKAFTGRDGWDEHSPSKKMKKFAEYYVQPIADVMKSKKGKITNVAKDLAKSVNNSFNFEKLNSDIISKMNRAVAMETGSINATASVKANNSMLNVIQATFNIDGSVAIDGQKAGRILAPNITKTIKAGGLV